MTGSRLLPHDPHNGCVITPAFRGVADNSVVPFLVVDMEGFFIYVNFAAEGVLACSLAELADKQVFEIALAESSQAAAEFEHLRSNGIWSGHALLQPLRGAPLRVAVNAYSHALPDGGAEHVALLHATSIEGPAIDRLPLPATPYGLTPREISLLQLMAEGFADKEVASILGTSVWTVNKDVGDVIRKLDVSSRTGACVEALKQHVIV